MKHKYTNKAYAQKLPAESTLFTMP